jgi:hypothetical protein
MEILVIIALHQPVTRPEIEDIRGARFGLKSLHESPGAQLLASGPLPWDVGGKQSGGRWQGWASTEPSVLRATAKAH